MKKIVFSLVFAFLLSLGFAQVNQASAGYVRSYYKSNGTYVNGYNRTRPNAYTYDNYSYKSPNRSNGYGYNNSYNYPKKSYSSSWYTPYNQ